MDRRNFLKKCAAAISTITISNRLCSIACADDKTQRPNILWIIAEDLSPDLACYGQPLVKTPNIDKLAAQGARYTSAFTTSPVCSPSRSAFMTGMYQTTIGCHNHRSHRYDDYTLPEPVKLITHYFREAGYFTSNCNADFKNAGKTDFNFKIDNPYDGLDFRDRKPNQPFYAQVNLYGVHRPFKTDPENPIDPDKVKLPPYYPDHPIARRDWADYLEHIQLLDKNVGKILKRLEDDGLADNTIVFFFGDNGRAHVRDKQFIYDGGIHVPLIVRWPGYIAPGTVINDLVSAIDLGPTSLNLAKIKPPTHMQGQIFTGTNTKKRRFIIAARDRCDETVDRIRCVRTKRFKYIRNFMPQRPYKQENLYKRHRYPVWSLLDVLQKQGKLTPAQALFMARTRPPEELYDLRTDPHEINNLAEDPKYQKTLKKLRSNLDNWIKQTSDRGQIPEDPQIAGRFYHKFLVPYYAKEMAQRDLTLDSSPEEYMRFWKRHFNISSP